LYAQVTLPVTLAASAWRSGPDSDNALGAAVFSTRSDIAVTAPTHILAGDFNGDGRRDMLVV
jgi:hypothetical protein